MPRMGRRAPPFVLTTLALALSWPAFAQAADPFEIQVYDGTANAPGVFGGELHVNHWATGRRDASAPELPLHGQTHLTLEPSFGVFSFWEVGAYFQGAIRADGAIDYAGTKLRSKLVTPPEFHPRLRLGLNVEVSYVPERYEADRWGSELRPIVAYDDGDWLFAANPNLTQSFGASADEGPAFEPAVKAARTLGPIALGLEYYAGFGPLASPLPWREQEHTLFEVIDLVSVDRLELDVGLGEGLSRESAGLVAKLIVGWSFEPAKPSEPGAATARALRSWGTASRPPSGPRSR